MKIPEQFPWSKDVWAEVDAIWRSNDVEQIKVLKTAAHRGVREQIKKYDHYTVQGLILFTVHSMNDEDKKDPNNKKANAFKREVLSELMAELSIETFDNISDVKVGDAIYIDKDGYYVLNISDKGILAVPAHKSRCYEEFEKTLFPLKPKKFRLGVHAPKSKKPEYKFFFFQ